MALARLRGVLLVVVGLALVWAGCRERGAPEICGNGADDDGNGAVDCADAECAASAVCVAMTDAGPSDAGPVDAPYVPIDVNLPDSGLVEECGPVDVVFVLDVSTSMEGTFGALRDGIRAVWDTATRLSPDPRFSMVVFVDDALAVDDCAPFGSVDGLSAAFDHWRSFCSSNASPVSLAPNFDFPENSLDALYLAATACTFREGATRVLVHVTDDTFRERPATFSGSVPAQRTYPEVSRALTAFQLRVASFHDTTEHPEGFSAPYRGEPSLVDATGGRAFSFDDVVNGRLDMGDAIQEFLVAEYCTPYLI
jgi:hypothetical protein